MEGGLEREDLREHEIAIEAERAGAATPALSLLIPS
jgi:hypothetical protein